MANDPYRIWREPRERMSTAILSLLFTAAVGIAGYAMGFWSRAFIEWLRSLLGTCS